MFASILQGVGAGLVAVGLVLAAGMAGVVLAAGLAVVFAGVVIEGR